MDYRNAAGRNWGSPRPKRRSFKLGQGGPPWRLPETLPPPGQLEHRDAAGRNWARERPARRRVDLSRQSAVTFPPHEAGGGDHDLPYRFFLPSSARPFPFTLRHYGRLLVLRGRLRDGELADDSRTVGSPDQVPAPT